MTTIDNKGEISREKQNRKVEWKQQEREWGNITVRCLRFF